MKQGILCSDIYKILAAPSYGYSITMYNEGGEATIVPSEAKWFYVKPVGFMIQVPNYSDADIRPEVYLWKSEEVADDNTKQVLERLKKKANQYGYGFTIYDFGTGNLPKKFSHIAMRDIESAKSEISESFTGSAMRSYFTLPKARLVIVHTERVDETINGSRTRNIKEMFIDSGGERRRVNSKNIHAGKALVRHLSTGGSWGDKFCSGINTYSEDLELLKELLSDLEIQGKTTQAQKTLGYINQIKQYLKQASTAKGYEKCLAQNVDTQRVGNKYIDAFAKRIMPTCGLSQSKAYARNHLLQELQKMSVIKEVILNNYNSELSPHELNAIARRVCLGAVPLYTQFETDDLVENKVLMYGTQIAKALGDCPEKEVLENISTKPYISEQDAMFVLCMLNSVLGNVVKQPEPEVLSTPEIVELAEWVKDK